MKKRQKNIEQILKALKGMKRVKLNLHKNDKKIHRKRHAPGG